MPPHRPGATFIPSTTRSFSRLQHRTNRQQRLLVQIQKDVNSILIPDHDEHPAGSCPLANTVKRDYPDDDFDPPSPIRTDGKIPDQIDSEVPTDNGPVPYSARYSEESDAGELSDTDHGYRPVHPDVIEELLDFYALNAMSEN